MREPAAIAHQRDARGRRDVRALHPVESPDMATLRPFRALMPSPDSAASVAAVPYDVVSTQEARALAAGNPLSFLHVSRAEIDLPAGTPIYSDQVYAKASANFEKLTKECPLETEETPSLYLYRLIMGDHEQLGLVAC